MTLLRIFETDPAAKPKVRENDTVGRFRSGRMVGNRPESLPTWRITTGDPEVADAVAQILGGTPEEWETAGEDFLEIISSADKVLVVLSAQDVRADMRLYGRAGMIHHCDGVAFLSPDEEKGKPCGCPTLYEDRKAFAKSGRGPQPYTFFTFRLADAYDLGKFRFQSTSWKLAEVVGQYVDALSKIDGEALCELHLEHVQYTTRSGRDVSYRKPALRVIKPWSAALEDDHGTDY